MEYYTLKLEGQFIKVIGVALKLNVMAENEIQSIKKVCRDFGYYVEVTEVTNKELHYDIEVCKLNNKDTLKQFRIERMLSISNR